MNAVLQTEFNPSLAVINGTIKTTSLKVAEHFCKRHDNVIRAIKRLECSNDFTALNFEECYRINELANGKPELYYEMTKDGFTFLAMGFTGKEAAKWKEAYINAFNRMADEIFKKSPYGLKQLPEPKTTYLTKPLYWPILWLRYKNTAPGFLPPHNPKDASASCAFFMPISLWWSGTGSLRRGRFLWGRW